jgi:hypothetical protein
VTGDDNFDVCLSRPPGDTSPTEVISGIVRNDKDSATASANVNLFSGIGNE